MAFLLVSRNLSRRLLNFDPKLVLCTTSRALPKAKKKSDPCIQAILKRPGETHDDKNYRLGRPLSPHLSIYKPQATSILSIMHRILGTAFSGYLILWGIWALVTPYDFCYVAEYLECLDPPPWAVYFARLVLAFPFVYHATNGIRHLVWDTARCLQMPQVYQTGAVMVTTALILTGVVVFLL